VSVGKTPYWMTTDVGKVFGQFMSFTIHSYNTHLLRGMNLRDWQMGMNWMTASFIAGTAWTGLTYAKYHNDPKKFQKEMTLKNMALKGFARSSAGGIPSMTADWVATFFGGDGIFNARYSSLDNKLLSLDNTPSISMANRVLDVLRRAGRIAGGQKPATADDLKAVLRMTPLTLLPSAIKGAENIFVQAGGRRNDPRK